MTMNTMKTLMLAGFTALSLGMGTAMAQEGGSTYEVAPDYWAPSSIAARDAQAGLIQSGSSDVTPTNSGATQAPLNWQSLPTYPGQG
jgi:hypothetical protein